MREGVSERERKRGRENAREGGREGKREREGEGEREGGREREAVQFPEVRNPVHLAATHLPCRDEG